MKITFDFIENRSFLKKLFDFLRNRAIGHFPICSHESNPPGLNSIFDIDIVFMVNYFFSGR
jgi:hypothetical protein